MVFFWCSAACLLCNFMCMSDNIFHLIPSKQCRALVSIKTAKLKKEQLSTEKINYVKRLSKYSQCDSQYFVTITWEIIMCLCMCVSSQAEQPRFIQQFYKQQHGKSAAVPAAQPHCGAASGSDQTAHDSGYHH